MAECTKEIPRGPLLNRTNIQDEDVSFDGTSEHRRTKRPKLDSKDTTVDSSDEEKINIPTIGRRRRCQTTYRTLMTAATGMPCRRRPHSISSRPILQSFISSHKSDIFSFHGTLGRATIPYACSYSHDAKVGGKALLAVATEQGHVLLFNTTKRDDWDFEPQKIALQVHDNAVFDVKWNHDDTRLVTASGDRTSRIVCVERQRLLHVLSGHTSTIKSVAWDPDHRDLLGTGGRNGQICIWDLRTNKGKLENGAWSNRPVLCVTAAHGQEKAGWNRKVKPLPRSVTSITYSEGTPHGLISGGSFDGILHFWDFRLPKESSADQPTASVSYGDGDALYSSPRDPTTLYGSRRPRGITSMTRGSGPSAGLLFALGADSRLHTYSIPSLTPLASETHSNMQTNSFYVRVATSPCGRWLATGSTASSKGIGRVFLYDISNAGKCRAQSDGANSPGTSTSAIELRGHMREVGAVDWAQDMLASCADDGTVRIWRPNLDVYRKCIENPEEQKWDWSWAAE